MLLGIVAIALFHSVVFSQSKETQYTVAYQVWVPDDTNPRRTIEVNVRGSAFLRDDFVEGQVIIADGERFTAKLRYNAYKDLFEIRKDSQPGFVLRKPEIAVKMNGDTYEVVTYWEQGKPKSGYMIALNQGKTRLLKRYSKQIGKFSPSSNGYDATSSPEFVFVAQYYIKRQGRPALQTELTRKDVCSALEDRYSDIRSFSKKRGLKLGTEAEVIMALEYYDGLNEE